MTRAGRWCDSVGAIVVVSALLLSGCSHQTPEASISSAKAYLAKGDANSALIQLKNAAQKQERNAEARFLLGQTLFLVDDFASAEKELRKARELGISADVVNPWLAQVLMRNGDYDGVIDLVGRPSALPGRDAAMLDTALGQAKLALGRNDGAQEAFAAAKAADATYGPAFTGLGRLSVLMGDLDGALRQSDAATAASPADPEAWQLKGDVLRANGDADGAIAAYRNAVKAKPMFAPAHIALINLLIATGKLDEAHTAFAELKALAPKHPETYYLEAVLSLKSNDLKAASEAVQLYRAINHDDLRGILLAATINVQRRAYADVESDLVPVLEKNPQLGYARRLLIGSYLELGKAGKALELLQPVLANADKDPNLANVAGEAYLRNGQPALAAEYFSKAARAAPATLIPRTGLALTHLAQGDRDRGMKELEAVATEDPGVRADVIVIANAMKEGRYDVALQAIDRVDKKQPKKPATQNLRGLALRGKGDVAGARKSFEQALALDPEFVPAAMNLAQVDLAEKNSAAAEKHLSSIVSRNPKNVPALLGLAGLRERNGGPSDEVADLINKAIAANPTDTGARLALIVHYLKVKDTRKALAAAADADAAIPRTPEILDALARAQLAADDANQAVKTYNRLGQLMPDSPLPAFRVAEIAAGQKDYETAVDNLRKALKLRPDFLDAQRALIAVDVARGNTQEALAVARTVQKQRANQAIGYVFEGDVYAAGKQWNDALRAYRAGLKHPDSTDAAVRVYGVLAQTGKQADADSFASTWIKEHPADMHFIATQAEAATNRGDYAGAMRQYQALLRAEPENPALLNNVAFLAGKLNDPRAVEYAEKASQLAPNQPHIMDTLGVLLVERGDTQRGIDLLKQAVQLSPGALNIRLDLAKSLIKAGQKDAAREQLAEITKAGDKYPGRSEAEQLLKSL